MDALNIALLHQLAGGSHPTPEVLLIARLFALWGAWACAIFIGLCAWRHRTEALYLMVTAVGAALASVLSHAIAAQFNIPRPFVAGLVPAYIAHGSSASLPSTHATVMFFVAFAMLFHRRWRQAGAVALTLAVLVGWARVYVGVHYPADIGFGMVLGALMAALLSLTWRLKMPRALPARPFGGEL